MRPIGRIFIETKKTTMRVVMTREVNFFVVKNRHNTQQAKAILANDGMRR